MKLIIFAALAGIALGARLDSSYLPPRPGGGFGSGSGFGGGGGSGFGGGGYSGGSHVPITRFENNNDGSGNYHYSYETGNGIQAEERGQLRGGLGGEGGEAAQGSFSYTGPDGQRYSIQYTADENGFRPVGAHLPTPPPIPEAILRSLEQNRAEEARGGGGGGGFGGGDDGQYRPSGNFGGQSGGYHY